VHDVNDQTLSYVYYESEPGRRAAAKLLSENEARRIAANIAVGTTVGKGAVPVTLTGLEPATSPIPRRTRTLYPP
jgi:uncharacterized protein (UPF0254 family)